MDQERQIKHERVVGYLQEHELDGVLLGRRCNFSWYTCGAHNHVGVACDAGSSWLLVTRDSARVLANNIEAARLRTEELADGGIEIIEFPYHDVAGARAVFEKATRSMRIAADAPVPYAEAAKLDSDFDRLRWSLTDTELDRYRRLATDTAEALERVACQVCPHQSENELAGMIAAELLRRGCNIWTLLVAGDERAEKFRHPLPTDRRVEKYFMLVAGAERDGLIASCTRLASFGSLSEELLAKHRAVATVDAALILSTRVGATLGEIFAAAQRAYATVGFPDEWRLHHQGGSCGYLPRERKAAPADRTVALANQGFAWNPSITGTKSEDTILCLPDGPEIMGASADYPSVEVEWEGRKLTRPAILQR
ncbi:MAG: M24 family metallopeptidase [Planctomycetota bacterium]|jgi:Xaa-Pro aminopeptidase